MPHSYWPCAVAFLFIVWLGLGIGRAVPLAFMLRFSDTLAPQDASHQTASAVLPWSEPAAPVVSANSWLMRHGWKQSWPLHLLGAGTPLFFAGPLTQRYLQLSADDDYYIWRRWGKDVLNQAPFQITQSFKSSCHTALLHTDRTVEQKFILVG